MTLSSIAVILIFFLVTSQILILRLPPIATQLFRPLMIAMIIIRMARNGHVRSAPRTLAAVAALHAAMVLLYHPESWNYDIVSSGIAVSLYFLMFSFAIGAAWTKQELKYIILASFLGCFACAVAILVSNNPTDFHAATDGHLELLGVSVNRNKNAYQYAFGSVLGCIYLLKGKRNKVIIFLITAVIAYALLYSQCRGAFLATVTSISALLIGKVFEIRKKSGNNKAVLFFLFLVMLYLGAFYLLKNSELSRLVDGDSTSGRDEGIAAAWKIFLNSDWFGKIFGNGFGYEHQQTGEIGAHLVYVSFLVSMGMIGSGLTALLFLKTFQRTFGSGAISLILVAFMKTFFESADYNVFIPLILGVVLCNYSRLNRRSYYELFGK